MASPTSLSSGSCFGGSSSGVARVISRHWDPAQFAPGSVTIDHQHGPPYALGALLRGEYKTCAVCIALGELAYMELCDAMNYEPEMPVVCDQPLDL